MLSARRLRPIGILALALASPLAGCSSCSRGSSADGGAPATSAAGAQGLLATPAPLSLPIAADHDVRGNVYVAGFVAARGAVNLSRIDEAGRLLWAVDVLTGLAFSPDEHIEVMASAKGPVVAWRGLADGGRVRVARLVDDDGKPRGNAFAVGAGTCAAGSSLFWIGAKDEVLEWPLPAGPAKKLVTIGTGRDMAIVCGDTRALIVDEGEEDLGVRSLQGGKAGPRSLLVSAGDLGDDEIREHEDFTFGDTLGELLLTEQGHLVSRRFTDKPSPRLAVAHVVGNEEDVMAVDGNASHLVAILTRDAGSRCDGDTGTDVLALDVPVDEAEKLIDVAHGDCGRDLGPYWVGPTSDAIYMAWSVRGPRTGSTKAPVEALAYVKLGAPDVKTVPLSAEDLVFAGCAGARCYFAELARPEGTDGMVPGEARVIAIP